MLFEKNEGTIGNRKHKNEWWDIEKLIVTLVLYFWCDKFENDQFESDNFTLL